MFRRIGFLTVCLLIPVWVAFAQSGGSGAAGVGLPTTQSAAYFKTIDKLLGTAKDTYRAGNPDAANEALIEAYLENFEYLEAPIKEADAELEEKLEKTLRVGLPELVRTEVSHEDFDTAVDAALADLDRAETLFK